MGWYPLITTLPLNRIRKRQGLPPAGKEGFTSPRLNLVPVSPAVYPPNPLWESRHRIVGYWFTDTPVGWQPPVDLPTFLENGDPPVAISLGAMSLGDEDALESASMFVEAIQQAGIRAIIQGWDSGTKQLTLPSNIYATGALPHSWLLPQCSAMVHHGGYGTTAAGLRAGIPALIADQFYWAQQVHRLGVGLLSIPRPKLNREGLASALKALAHGSELHEAASILGKKIRAENGIIDAVNLIEEMFG
jgi:sterol 3beta-glucosyltransferase